MLVEPENSKNLVAAVISVVALFGFLAAMVVMLFIEIPSANENLFNMSLMALVAIVNQGVGFYLGSSVGSGKKDEAIKNLSASVASPAVVSPIPVVGPTPPKE